MEDDPPCWAFIYNRLPKEMFVDRKSAFEPIYIIIAAISKINVDRPGTETHSSLKFRERYHQPLQTYPKIMPWHANVEPENALAAAVKAMNDTLLPRGLRPSFNVFGEFIQILNASKPAVQCTSLASWAKTSKAVRTEMQNYMSKLRVSHALKQKTTEAADRNYKREDKVLGWKEKVVDSLI